MRVKLKDIASFSKGTQINGDKLLPDGQYSFLNGGIQPSGKWNDYNVDENTIAISEGGNSCGYVNFMKAPFWCGAHCYYLFDLKYNEKYIFYALKSQQGRLMQLRTGACMPNIKKRDLSEFEFEIDRNSEKQKAVVHILDKINDLLEKRQRQLSKLDELVKVRFVEMFGDPRQNPMGWETPPLSKCLRSIDNGKSFVCKPEPRKGNWPAVLKLSAATYGVFKPEENKAVLDANEFVKEAEVHPNDLLFTRKNTPELVGMSAYVFDTAPNLMMPDLIFRLNPNESCNKIFLWQLINHDLFRTEISGLASGSAQSMSNISKERLANLKIICPPIELQQKFAQNTEQIHRQKLTIQQSLDKLEVLKKSLMQEYFG